MSALTEVLAAHQPADDWKCKCGMDCFGGTAAYTWQVFLAHVEGVVLSTLDERADIAAAEQRGREDNADHGMCLVSGSKALEAILDERDALRAQVDEALSERDEAELSGMRAKTETAEWVSAYDVELVRRKTLEAQVERVRALADEWALTEFPHQATADVLELDLRRALDPQ